MEEVLHLPFATHFIISDLFFFLLQTPAAGGDEAGASVRRLLAPPLRGRLVHDEGRLPQPRGRVRPHAGGEAMRPEDHSRHRPAGNTIQNLFFLFGLRFSL